MVAAETARRIAEHHPALDADAAYVMALLHDIGSTCATGHDVLQFKSKAGHAALVASTEVCSPWTGIASHENSP
jgi:HD superfamily phosphodiesterase